MLHDFVFECQDEEDDDDDDDQNEYDEKYYRSWVGDPLRCTYLCCTVLLGSRCGGCLLLVIRFTLLLVRLVFLLVGLVFLLVGLFV